MKAMDELRALLRRLPEGRVHGASARSVLGALAYAWPALAGGKENAMASYKVARAEELEWRPPELSFVIERHGARQFGSKFAELQRWEVNPEMETAWCEPCGKRLLEPLAARVNVGPMASEIVIALRNGEEHPALAWAEDQGEARLRIGALLPASSTNKQTLAGRRKRLRAELQRQALEQGWALVTKGSVVSLRRAS